MGDKNQFIEAKQHPLTAHSKQICKKPVCPYVRPVRAPVKEGDNFFMWELGNLASNERYPDKFSFTPSDTRIKASTCKVTILSDWAQQIPSRRNICLGFTVTKFTIKSSFDQTP